MSSDGVLGTWSARISMALCASYRLDFGTGRRNGRLYLRNASLGRHSASRRASQAPMPIGVFLRNSLVQSASDTVA